MKVIIYGTGLITEDNNPTNDFHVGSGNAFNSGIEFNCARYGISIVGYIQPNINKTPVVFKDIKIIEPRELASIEYDYIIINNQFDKSDVHSILSTSGIDTQKALSFKSDFHTIIRAFESSSSGIQIISATLMDEWREVANC